MSCPCGHLCCASVHGTENVHAATAVPHELASKVRTKMCEQLLAVKAGYISAAREVPGGDLY
jgi:hypothetical protein